MRECLMRGLDKIIAARFAIIKVALFVLIFATVLPWNCHADIPAVERQALIALYNSTDGDNWTNNSGWKDAPLYTDGFAMPWTENGWYGVTCDDLNTKVTHLNFNDNQLTGSIPPELGNLSNLGYIWFTGNELTGSIPPELGNLSNLLYLCLNDNQLTGSIPPELGNLSNLLYLYLNDNQLTGSIPPELGNLSNLLYLCLNDNQLTGSIPPELGNLSNLLYLYLNDNQLTGSIPPELGNLSNLGYLCLNDNQLTGSIPPELGNLSNLGYIWFTGNELTGSIPPELGNLSNLSQLLLSGNQLTGNIPTSLTKLTDLTSTDIGYNALHTDDNTLRIFLDSKDSDWETTQTIAPRNVSANSISSTSTRLSWSPIDYDNDPGGYRIYYSTISGGPYLTYGITANKLEGTMDVIGLRTSTTYYFIVKTHTDPHPNNKNTVLSDYSMEIAATTSAEPKLRVHSVQPNFGVVGRELNATVYGTGFDQNTSVSIYPDFWDGNLTLGSIDTPYRVKGISVKGNLAYVPDFSYMYGGGLYVVDISDSLDPLVLGYLETGLGGVNQVEVSETIAYVTVLNRLMLIDVSNPSNPVLINTISIPGTSEGLTVENSIAYVASASGGLQIIDVSDPFNMQILGSVDTPDIANRVAVSGEVAYLIDRVTGAPDSYGGLYFIDISDKRNPKLIHSVDIPGNPRDIAISGTLAYVVSQSNGLFIIDISNSSHPSIISSTNIPSYYSMGIFVVGRTAYIADGNNGLQIIDISNPFSPEIIGSIDTLGFSEDVAVANGVAYVADGNNGVLTMQVLTDVEQVTSISYDNLSITTSGIIAPRSYALKAHKGLDSANLANAMIFYINIDSDNDGIIDDIEKSTCTEEDDSDTDNDGILDGVEDANKNGVVDAGETNPCNLDTDGDGIQDGTELGYTSGVIGPDTDTSVFQPDIEPGTTTDPLEADSDNDGMSDGEEDSDFNGRIDSGETAPNSVDRFVSTLGSDDLGDGIKENPWLTIQHAIDSVQNGSTIHVADGTYTGHGNKNLDFNGKAITVQSENGPETCIIDCEGEGRGFYFHNGEESDSVLQGFTVKNGYASSGGGLECTDSSSPTINNCIFLYNMAQYNGGGLFCSSYSSPAINNCSFSNNSCGSRGGGVHNSFSSPILTSCVLSKNSANQGGGMFNWSSSPIVTNCRFIENLAIETDSFVGFGGGMDNREGSKPHLSNVIFSENTAHYGGGINNSGLSEPEMVNCVFNTNTAIHYGGGLYNYDSVPSIRNCTFCGNIAVRGAGIINNSGSPAFAVTNCIFGYNHTGTIANTGTLTLSYCLFEEAFPGEALDGGGNILGDPLFIDKDGPDDILGNEDDNFHLQYGSPCIDSGDPNSLPDPDGSRADMGALYFSEKLNLSINTHWYNWATTFPEYQNKIAQFNFVRDGAWWSTLEITDYITSDDWGNAAWSYPYEITITNCNQSTTYQSGYDELVKKFQAPDAPGLLLLIDIHNDNLNVDANAITYDQFYDYVHHIVERYDGDGYKDMPGLTRSVIYFEIGNEVDSSNPQHSHNLSLENYVNNRLIPAYRAAKAANPSAVILNAGLAMGDDTGFDTTYLQNMLDLLQVNNGEQNNYYMDKLAIHYYFDPQDPEYFDQNIQQVKSMMKSYNLGSKPVWITEFGIATKNDAGGQIREEDQASVLLRYRALMNFHNIQNSFIYNLKDVNSSEPSDWENVYGIYKIDCQGASEIIYEKSSVKMLDTFYEKTAGLSVESINPEAERNQGIYKVTFSDTDKKVQTIWYTAFDNTGINPDRSSEMTVIPVSLDGNTGILSDMYGNVLDPDVEDGQMIIIGEKPQYLEFPNRQDTYTIRMSNVDDLATLYINDIPLYKSKWGYYGVEPTWYYFGHQPGDSGEVDITSYVVSDKNTLRFTLWNVAVCCGASLTIEVKKNGETIIQDSFSVQDSTAGIKYDKTFTIKSAVIDQDNDGMPNDWEEEHGLDPSDPLDAAGDPDSDGLENLDEYLNGTNPNNPDTDGDGVSDGDEVGLGTDPNSAESVTTQLSRDTVTVSLTGNNRIFVEVKNLFCESKDVAFSLTGIDPDWYTITPEDQAFTLAPFEKRIVTIQLLLPFDCTLTAQDYPFDVETSWQVNGDVQNSSDSGLLTITSVPNVYSLALPNDTKLAANRIFLAWKTDVACDSNVYYRKLGDDDFTVVEVATQTDEHRVSLENLDFFTYYEFYTENISSCGEVTVSRLYQARTGKAIKFVDDVNEFWIDRDYNQLVTLSITNTDIIEHTFSLSVTNENNDIQVGFVGDGTPQREATLLAGESRDVELVINANDALMTDYNIYLKMVSDEGHFDSFLETVHAVIHVRPFVANLNIQPVDSTPGTMTKRFRLMNYGDALSDIEVFVDTQNRIITTLNPAIHHVRLENGGYVEFDISADSYTTGTVYAHSGTYTVSAPFEIGCEPGTDLTTYTVNDVSIVAVIQDWYCTNKMHVELPFAVPRGFSHEDLSEAALEMRFELPMAYEKYDPHDVTISINGSQVAVFENEIPQGTYLFRFPTSIIHLGADAPAKNILTINASGITPGHYIVATDFKVMLNVDEMDVTLCVPFPKPPDPPIEKYPPKVTLPDPHTRVASISPAKKFRPGQTVSVSTVLSNDDSSNNPPHQGLLTVQLTNDSANGVVPFDSRTFDVTIAGGQRQTLSFDYTIPQDADDIDYTFSATFQNNTLNETMPYASVGFWVRTPLIIVHGIKGSILVDDELPENDSYEKVVWSPETLFRYICDDRLESLEFDSIGNPVKTSIRPTRVIKKIFDSKILDMLFDLDIFNGLENELGRNRFPNVPDYKFHPMGSKSLEYSSQQLQVDTENPEDVFYFVYDWRLDNAWKADGFANGNRLSNFIDQVVTKLDYPKVNVMAHSLGGLLCKSMLSEDGTAQDKINKIIFLGTPNIGVPEAFSAIRNGIETPMIGNVISADFIEWTGFLIGTLGSLDVSDPGITSQIQTIVEAHNAIMSNSDPNYCSEVHENILVILSAIKAIKAIINPASTYSALIGILDELHRLYSFDKDINLVNDVQLKQTVKNMPGAHQLLPSDEYFTYFPDGYYQLDQTLINHTSDPSIDELINFSGNPLLHEASKALHSTLDGMQGSAFPTDSFIIAGCGKGTSTLIQEYLDQENNFAKLVFNKGDGDGTVPLESALHINTSLKFTALGAKHSNLPSQEGIILLIRSILKGHEDAFQSDSSHPVELYSNDGFCGLPTGTRIIIKPSTGLSGFEGSLGSTGSGSAGGYVASWPKVYIQGVTGSNGFMGITGNTIHTGIIGADYRATNGGIEVFVPDGAVYTLEFKGVDAEYIDIKLQMMTEGGVIKTYVFYDIPIDVNGNGIVDINLTDPMTDPVLRLDQDGDGQFETTGIPPSYVLDEYQSADFMDPATKANISGTMGENDWYTSNVSITLTATDNAGGSGIMATRYRLSGDGGYTEYSGPINITEPGKYTLTYYSIDKNLNKETEKVLELKTDNVAPQVMNVTDEGYFSMNTAGFSASWDIETGLSCLQDVRYSLGTAPGSTDVMDWTSVGAVSEIQATGLSLAESCTEQIYINIQAVNSAGVTSDIVSSDGVIVLESGGDPDGDGYDNESELAAGSNPCNELSIPKETIPQLKKGFNFLSIPADVEFQQDLKNWLPVLGNATEIEKVMVYDNQAGKFVTLIPDSASNPSFMLQGGEGLIVYAKQDKEITFTSVLCATLDLKPGFNLVGFACPEDGYSAYQLLNDLGSENISSIQRYSTEKGAFETASFRQDGLPVGEDFSIVSGEGYFVLMHRDVLRY